MKILAFSAIGFTLLFILGLFFIGFAMVPEPTPENTRTVEVGVSEVRLNSSKDIQFISEWGGDTVYYINRGEELGLNTDEIKNFIAGKEVALSYIDHRSPLDWNNQTRHLVRVSCNDSLIFEQ